MNTQKELTAEILKLLSNHSVEDVIFTGEVSEEDKIRYFNSSDIFCAPATGRESFGIVLLEAMASKLPIVATSIDGFKQVLSNRRESLLVAPKDVNELSKALSLLINDAELRKDLADEGYYRVGNYSWDIICERIINYYKKVSEIKNRISRSHV